MTFNVVMGSQPGAQGAGERRGAGPAAGAACPGAPRRAASRRSSRSSSCPGDVVLLEAGDLVPADGRIVTSATLEVQEAALTGESAPVAKDADDASRRRRRARRPHEPGLPEHAGHARLGDVRRDRDRARRPRWVASPTWSRRRKRVRSPLQRELDGLTKIFGLLAWAAVAIIAIVGIARGQDTETLVAAVHLDRDLGDPDRAADVRADDAVVGRATPRRVQGGRQVAHRRRDARRHDGDQQRQDRHADDERDDGDDDAGRRRVVQDRRRRLHEDRRDPRRRRRDRCPTSRRLALGLVLCSDATVGDDESVIGDPTEAAFVVLAAKMGVDAEETRAALPRAGRGAVRLRVQVHGDVPRPPRLDQPAASCRSRTS